MSVRLNLPLSRRPLGRYLGEGEGRGGGEGWTGMPLASPRSRTPGPGGRPPFSQGGAGTARPFPAPRRAGAPRHLPARGASEKKNTHSLVRSREKARCRGGGPDAVPGAANLEECRTEPAPGHRGGVMRARGGARGRAPPQPLLRSSTASTQGPRVTPVLPSPRPRALTHRRGRPAPRPVAAGRRIGERASPRRRRP